MTPEQFVERLDGVKKTGKGWIAKCPAHDDKNPSLSVCEGDTGAVLVKCWGGCETSDVLAALDVSFSDLFPDSERNATPQQKREYARYRKQTEWQAALKPLAAAAYIIEDTIIEASNRGAFTVHDKEKIAKAFVIIMDARARLT